MSIDRRGGGGPIRSEDGAGAGTPPGAMPGGTPGMPIPGAGGGALRAAEIRVRAVSDLPEIEAGDELGELICESAIFNDGDVLVVSQKVVSKAEGRLRALGAVIPGAEARRYAAVLGKEPALVQLILDESAAVIRAERGVLIVETHHGLVCANAGIDSSNVPEEDTVCLLPEDPDASARAIRAEIAERTGARVGVVVADSFGRAWRIGQAEVAIGCAGLRPLDDWRGRADADGNELRATLIAIADQAAGAADLVRDKASAAPAAILSGIGHHVGGDDGPGAAAIRRPKDEDLFR
jgi:coenzyme F420-0:L-glutamate ligase/coenzyme F420-1:gamma-L-glutamate ligase